MMLCTSSIFCEYSWEVSVILYIISVFVTSDISNLDISLLSFIVDHISVFCNHIIDHDLNWDNSIIGFYVHNNPMYHAYIVSCIILTYLHIIYIAYPIYIYCKYRLYCPYSVLV